MKKTGERRKRKCGSWNGSIYSGTEPWSKVQRRTVRPSPGHRLHAGSSSQLCPLVRLARPSQTPCSCSRTHELTHELTHMCFSSSPNAHPGNPASRRSSQTSEPPAAFRPPLGSGSRARGLGFHPACVGIAFTGVERRAFGAGVTSD
ncbi:hypothetical protein M758_2G160500 [Ceratodon purpureus]|nr:hypothetical protein M758_2G160500 [Ceratodon purpureus]